MPICDVLYGSTDPQLTTTAMVKQLMGTTSTEDDAEIDTLITAASRWAEGVVGYPLSAQRYVELVPSYGTRRLMLSKPYVRAVVAGPFSATDTGAATEIQSSEYRLNSNAGMLDRNAGWAWTAPDYPYPMGLTLTRTPWAGQEAPSWLVDYVAGFTLGMSTGSQLWSTRSGTTSTGRTLPADIERAVALKAVAMYEGSEGVAEKSVGDLKVRYGSYGSKTLVTDPAEVLLLQWRKTI